MRPRARARAATRHQHARRCPFLTPKSVLQFAIVYGSLAAGLIGVYALVVGWLEPILPRQSQPGISLLAAGVGGLLFASARGPLSRVVHRALYGSPDAPETMLAGLAQRLEASLEPDAVLSATVEVVAQALGARYAAIYLKRLDAEALVLAAQHRLGSGEIEPQSMLHPGSVPAANPGRAGMPSSGQLAFPLIDRSEAVGQLVVLPREDRSLTAQERRQLAAIARRAGSAAQAVRQAHDLRRARERLVLAREEERRRLRRNLHDSIGPTLAALSLKAGAVRSLIESDPRAAQEEMTELRQQIHAVITDIRRVVYDLRPPALDELGMLPAIREQARQFSTGHLKVSVDAPEQLPALPAAVEVAVYRIVMEALTNVERHARARKCRIELSVNDRIEIEVTDDGVGLPAGHWAGVGISSMRERVAELGGSCTIETRPEGGTRVRASLPLGSAGP